jgi:hypothetical protein
MAEGYFFIVLIGEGWTSHQFDFVIFPMSFSFDNDSVFVTCGKNDRSGWVLNLDRLG